MADADPTQKNFSLIESISQHFSLLSKRHSAPVLHFSLSIVQLILTSRHLMKTVINLNLAQLWSDNHKGCFGGCTMMTTEQ